MFKLIRKINQIRKEENEKSRKIEGLFNECVKVKEKAIDLKQKLLSVYRDVTLVDELEIEQDILNLEKMILEKQKEMAIIRRGK